MVANGKRRVPSNLRSDAAYESGGAEPKVGRIPAEMADGPASEGFG